ncbi:YD repeat-containing protein [Pedobacter sp. UYEF25]
MNKSKLILSAFVLLSVASCRKAIDQSINLPKVEACSVAEITNSGSEPAYLTYNADGKLTRIDKGSKTSDNFETFSYTATGILTHFEYPSGSEKITGSSEYTLDGSGRVVSMKATNGEVTTFTYDNEGHLAQANQKTSNGTNTITCNWSNGNLTQIIESSGVTTTLTYGEEKSSDEIVKGISLPSNFTDYGDFDITYLSGYFGKSSINLVISSTSLQANKNLYSYVKDADGKIVKRIAYQPGTMATSTTELVYNCK